MKPGAIASLGWLLMVLTWAASTLFITECARPNNTTQEYLDQIAQHQGCKWAGSKLVCEVQP